MIFLLLSSLSVYIKASAVLLPFLLAPRRQWLWFAVGCLWLLMPWLVRNECILGRPILTTTASWNFYLGANPLADGRGLDTRAEPQVVAQAAHLDELNRSRFYEAKALGWIEMHPVEYTWLAARKIGLFWNPMPNWRGE